MLRQLVGVEVAPIVRAVALADGGCSSQQTTRDQDEAEDQDDVQATEESAELVPPKARLSAIASTDDVDALFGG